MADKQTNLAGASHASRDSEANDIETLARLAGLENTLKCFPEDVTTAARTALKIRASFQAPVMNTAEVWPVMQVKS